jgi:hypothetical protein
VPRCQPHATSTSSHVDQAHHDHRPIGRENGGTQAADGLVICGALSGGRWSLSPRARPSHRQFKPVTRPIPTTPAAR